MTLSDVRRTDSGGRGGCRRENRGWARTVEVETGLSGTCIKDTWTKPKGGRIKGRSGDGWGEGSGGGEMQTLYLKNNKKKKRTKKQSAETMYKDLDKRSHLGRKDQNRRRAQPLSSFL